MRRLVTSMFLTGCLFTNLGLAAEATAPPAGSESMVDSPWFNIGMPKFEMPKVNWKGPFAGEKKPGEGNPLTAPFKNGIAKTRTAWNNTIEKFRFGAGGGAPATEAEQPGFLARMFGAEEEPTGPLTTSEFLAQERPGTEKK